MGPDPYALAMAGDGQDIEMQDNNKGNMEEI